MDRKIIYKPYNFLVTAPNTSYSQKFILDKSVRLVRKVLMSANIPNQLYYRGSQRIEVSGDELFPEDFESKHFTSGISVAPDLRWVDLGEVPAGNGEIKILYKDENNIAAAFSPYRVTIIFQCEIK